MAGRCDSLSHLSDHERGFFRVPGGVSVSLPVLQPQPTRFSAPTPMTDVNLQDFRCMDPSVAVANFGATIVIPQ